MLSSAPELIALFRNLFLITLCVLSQNISAAIANPPDDGNPWAIVDSSGGGNYVTIQGALAADEQYIFIRKGTYQTDRSLNIEVDGTKFLGESKHDVVIEAVPDVCADLLFINANYAEVAEITVRQTPSCPWTAVVSANHSHITFRDSIVHGSDSSFAIFFAGPEHATGPEPLEMLENNELDSYNKVLNNEFHSNFNGDVLSFSLQKNGLVKGNTLYGGLIAIFMDRDTICEDNLMINPVAQGIFVSVPSYDVTIRNNTIQNPFSSGIKVGVQIDHLDENGKSLTPDSHRSTGIQIYGNTIENSRLSAIEINNLADSTITDNIITAPDFSGIYLYRSDNLYVAHNTITDAARVAAGESTNLHGWSTNWDSGIYLDQYVADSLISSNTINGENHAVQRGIAINPHWDGNTGNQILWNQLLGSYQYETVHSGAAEDGNTAKDNFPTERNTQDLWLQVASGKGKITTGSGECTDSCRITTAGIEAHTFTAIPGAGYRFAGWLKPADCAESTGDCTATNNSDLDVVASFVPESDANKILLGIYHGNEGWRIDRVNALETWQNKKQAVLALFTNFNPTIQDSLFNIQLPDIWDNGNVPLISWEPYLELTATPASIESDIAAGNYDEYITEWAKDLKDFLAGDDGAIGTSDDRRAFMALAHEMNGDWYPWSAIESGESPDNYVAMWRHIYDIFAEQGIGPRNLQWMWTVNNFDAPTGHVVEDYYPGDDYVDWLSVDGYNWGASPQETAWKTPAEAFDPMLTRLRLLSDKPISIKEVGTYTDSGQNLSDKNTWISEFFDYIEEQGIRLVNWFNLNKSGYDWAVFGKEDGSGYGDETAANGEKAYSAYREAVQQSHIIASDPTHPQIISDTYFLGRDADDSQWAGAEQITPSVLFPLYAYPNHWDTDNYIWDDIAAAQSRVDITAIVNPDNGPGSDGTPNSDYQIGLQTLRDAGVTMLGYVATCWANSAPSVSCYNTRTIDDMKIDIKAYADNFNVHGIFFDEGATGAEQVAIYDELSAYARSLGLAQIVVNPGVTPDQGYINNDNVANTSVNFESPYSSWVTASKPDDWTQTVSARQSAMLVYDAPETNVAEIVNRALQWNYGYLYVTDDGDDGNPWDSLPAYWGTLLDNLEGLVAGDDYDQDGILNAVDNCAGIANVDQADGDSDGYGDVCDSETITTPVNPPVNPPPPPVVVPTPDTIRDNTPLPELGEALPPPEPPVPTIISTPQPMLGEALPPPEPVGTDAESLRRQRLYKMR